MGICFINEVTMHRLHAKVPNIGNTFSVSNWDLEET
jgi:hypothetical protein